MSAQPLADRTWPRMRMSDFSPGPSAARPVDGMVLTDHDLAARLSGVLDCFEQGVVLVSASSRVLFASTYARELLSGERGISVVNGHLRVRSPAAAATLRHLIARCAAEPGQGEATYAPCRVGQPALSLIVARAGGTEGSDPADGAAAMIFITDPTSTTLPSSRYLRDYFGLTGAEASLALEIISGKGIKTAAGRLRISVETARTHLRHIFSKTGATRQAELVRLLLLARHNLRQPIAHAAHGGGER